jgi:DNA (cytosine-5)-methyltransferase 1
MIAEPVIVASRGRNPKNPSDRTQGNHVEQRLEPNTEGLCNTLTSVQKDNLVLEPCGIYTNASKDYQRGPLQGMSRALKANQHDSGVILPNYRIRKLTPLECWRLMDFTDEDFHKAAEVNSNTQLYKEAGNSIVKAVLMAIFRQMLGGKK